MVVKSGVFMVEAGFGVRRFRCSKKWLGCKGKPKNRRWEIGNGKWKMEIRSPECGAYRCGLSGLIGGAKLGAARALTLRL